MFMTQCGVWSPGAVVGISELSYSGTEGGILEICVVILSPNATVLALSTIQGTFNISGIDGTHIFYFSSLISWLFFTFLGVDIVPIGGTEFVLNSMTSSHCLNLSLDDDGLIEGSERVVLSLEEIYSVGSFGIRLLEPNSTTITITDANCEFTEFWLFNMVCLVEPYTSSVTVY